MNLNNVLTKAWRYRASDIHLKSDLRPLMRVDGKLLVIPDEAQVTAAELKETILALMSERQKEQYLASCELDMSYIVPNVARFRLNVFQQRGVMGAVFRVIPFNVATIDSLHLPAVLEQIAAEERGLVLVTGTTGSGKSTTLAAIIDYINAHRAAHIVTIEDPIEFIFKDNYSAISQREIGFDTFSYAAALKSALRQDPDVILIGEMRDVETIEIALTAAETGHLVLSTLHTLDAAETINRIISLFPQYQHQQIRTQLGTVLKAIVCQRLVPMADGHGRVPAVEVLRMTAHIRELIDDQDRTREVVDAMADGNINYGMQTFDQSLMELLTGKQITYDEALRQSSHPDDFALRYSGIHASSDGKWESFEHHEEPKSEAPNDGEMEVDLSAVPVIELGSKCW